MVRFYPDRKEVRRRMGMKRRIISENVAVKALSIFVILACVGLLFHSLFAQRYTQTAAAAIETGKTQLFQKTVSGALSAYQTFQGAYDNDYASAGAADKIKIRVWLAATRMMDLLLRTDGGDVDSLTKLLAQYGITRTQDAQGLLESVKFNPPLNNADKIILPAGAPPTAEALRAFFAGPFLAAVNASISDMDAAIVLCPTDGSEGVDQEIITKAMLGVTDPTRLNIELDAGDYHLFRSFLKLLKVYALMNAAYNSEVNIREIVALVNVELGMKMFRFLLDRYPGLLTIRDAGGAAQSNEARLTLIDAITDYEAASAKIRNDNAVAEGAEEFLSLDEDDAHEEGMFRENFAKIKTSLQSQTGNEPADLVTYRMGTEYSVYGGSSFTVNEPSWWEKGYHPERYGYTLLKTTGNLESASNTATFNGSYNCYIIVTRPGNMAPVDAVQGSNNAYYTTDTTGSVRNWGNVSGAPDGAYALIGGGSDGNGPGFMVIRPPTAITSLTVYLTNVSNIAREDHFKLNLFPLFGNGSIAPKPLRALLPQLNAYGYPMAGTMGSGLSNDATLGGILPDMTQNQWVRENREFFQPVGNVMIAAVADGVINVQDATTGDWGGISPVLDDLYGETGDPASDIRSLYLARDATYLYIRIDTAGTIPASSMAYGLALKSLPTAQYEVSGDLKVRVYYDWFSSQWLAQLYRVNSQGYMAFVSNLGSADFKVFGNHVEMRVSLSPHFLELGGRFIRVFSEPAWGGSGGDRRDTCLQIQPTASVTGNLNVPNYDGVGPVRIGVYVYSANFSTAPEKRIGSLGIYPDGSGSLPATYTLSNLPIGVRVFVFLFWDRDGNGVVSPGDYTNFSQPFTTVAGGNAQNLVVNDDHPAYLAPKFNFASIQNERLSTGSWDILMAASLTGPSPEDVTVTVTGPAGEFTLTPGNWIANRWGLIYKNTVSWLPAGDYTFAAVDSLGRKAEKTVHYGAANYSLGPVTGLSPGSGAYTGTATPTLSWTPPAGGPYAYQVWIVDFNSASNGVTWYVSDFTQANSFTVPAGVLLPDTPYAWFVRIYDSASQPVNFAVSAANALYTGSASTALAYSSVQIGGRPPTGAITTYSYRVDAKLPGVAPWNVTAWRLKQGGTTIASGGTPYFFNRTDEAYFEANFSLSYALPTASDYRFEMDINRSGAATLTRNGISFTFSGVDAVDVTSLVPAGNYYFKIPTPTFSWGLVSDPNAYYRLRLYEARGMLPLYTSAWSREASATVPAGVLKMGGNYYWTVMTASSINPAYVTVYANTEGNSGNKALFRFTLQPPQPGDINGNGEVDLEDAVVALKLLSGITATVVQTGDVDGDARIGLPEAIYILQAISGLRQ
jgi:hypothetical protein